MKKFTMSFKGKALTITNQKTDESVSLVLTAAGIVFVQNKRKKYANAFLVEVKKYLANFSNSKYSYSKRLAVVARMVKNIIDSCNSFKKLYTEVKLQNIAAFI